MQKYTMWSSHERWMVKLYKKLKKRLLSCENSRFCWSEWRDSFAFSSWWEENSGSARSSPRRRCSSAPHLIFRVSLHTNKKVQNLRKQILDFWSEWRDSNSRHPGPKPGALPTGPHPGKYIVTSVRPCAKEFCYIIHDSGRKSNP